MEGFEPSTLRLTVECTAVVLHVKEGYSRPMSHLGVFMAFAISFAPLTGFEPAISSVTGMRDYRYSTGAWVVMVSPLRSITEAALT